MKNENEMKASKTQKFKNMIKSHKLLSVLCLMTIFTIGMGSAYYIFGYETEIVYTINGTTADLIISNALTDQFIDVSNNMFFVTQDLIIDNGNGEVDMLFEIIPEFNSTDELCNYTDDLNITFYDPDGFIMSNLDNYLMISGMHNFVLNVSLNESKAQRACPGNLSLIIKFTENI